MQPPYQITPQIIELIAQIAESLGQLQANYFDKPAPQLRKSNKIQTIHASLGIEGNTLSLDQVTAIIEEKPVFGPKKDVQEVLNALEAYEQLQHFDPANPNSFLKAHEILMRDLVLGNGKYRSQGVGIMAGERLAHLAPPAGLVPNLMNDLFAYLKKSADHDLIKACVFHYEMEFIHPFMDGNGRMGRLWQTLILMQTYPIFEFIPIENAVKQNQASYYDALSKSDQIGNATPFMTYMLEIINGFLKKLVASKQLHFSSEQRLRYFCEGRQTEFTRKDYMAVFKDISTATASRDLQNGVSNGKLQKTGEKSTTVYVVVEKQ
jgi:Fic family protein